MLRSLERRLLFYCFFVWDGIPAMCIVTCIVWFTVVRVMPDPDPDILTDIL